MGEGEGEEEYLLKERGDDVKWPMGRRTEQVEEVGEAGRRSRQVEERAKGAWRESGGGMGRTGEGERGGVVESGSREGEGKWRGVVKKSGQEEWGCRVGRELRGE